MIDLASISRLVWFPGIAVASPKGLSAFRDWLVNEAIVPHSSASIFEVEYLIEEHLTKALAYDANSFALKAIETIDAITVNEEFPRASAWPAIKIYYAAFFSIVFLMRLSGRGPLFLYAQDVTKLKSICSLYGVPSALKRGSYSIICEPLTKRIKLERMPEGLGVHEGAWRQFLEFLLFLEASLPNLVASESEKGDIKRVLTALTVTLRRNNNLSGNWLSSERNSINYQAYPNFWFPYKDGWRSSTLLKTLNTCNANFDVTKLSGNVDADVFFSTCSFIFGWAFAVMEDIAKRTSGEKTLFAQGLHNYIAKTSLKNIRRTAA